MAPEHTRDGYSMERMGNPRPMMEPTLGTSAPSLAVMLHALSRRGGSDGMVGSNNALDVYDLDYDSREVE